MSSLIFYTDPDNAIIATDTLAVGIDGNPLQFTSKALFLPHLRLVIAGTGIGGFSTRWFVQVNDWMHVRGIDHLDKQTTLNLSQLYASYRAEDFPDGITTTIYHFGISEVSGDIHAYAYRSETGFASQRLSHGLKFKPECVVPENNQLPRDFVPMMESQRAIQRNVPREKRLYIGGEIHVIHIQRTSTLCYCLHRFEDDHLTPPA